MNEDHEYKIGLCKKPIAIVECQGLSINFDGVNPKLEFSKEI